MKNYVFLIFFILPFTSFGQQIIHIDNAQLIELVKDSTAQLVDVRTESKFKEGHIKGASNVNWYSFYFSTSIKKLNSQQPIILYCRTGIRSKKASAAVQKLGFRKIYNLKNGFLFWKKEGYPVEK